MNHYDPKLREAAEEFKSVCKKYDCAGVVLFVSPTHAEFVAEVRASWSVLTIQDGEIRLRSKKEDFNSKEEQDRATEATVHLVTSIINWSRKINETMNNLLELTRGKMMVIYSIWGEPSSTPGDGK